MSQLFTRIDTVFLRVTDLKRALEWYHKVFSLEMGWADIDNGYASLKLGETPLTLVATPTDQFVPQTSHAPFNFFVPDAEAAHAHLTSLGIECTPIVTDSVKWFDFYDADGNLLSVCNWH